MRGVYAAQSGEPDATWVKKTLKPQFEPGSDRDDFVLPNWYGNDLKGTPRELIKAARSTYVEYKRQWNLGCLVHHLLPAIAPPRRAHWSAQPSWRPGDIVFFYSGQCSLPEDLSLGQLTNYIPAFFEGSDERYPADIAPAFPWQLYYGNGHLNMIAMVLQEPEEKPGADFKMAGALTGLLPLPEPVPRTELLPDETDKHKDRDRLKARKRIDGQLRPWFHWMPSVASGSGLSNHSMCPEACALHLDWLEQRMRDREVANLEPFQHCLNGLREGSRLAAAGHVSSAVSLIGKVFATYGPLSNRWIWQEEPLREPWAKA